ncbi:MAG: ATP-binding protein, partial [Alphaproteobacteria bacterium]|nr:ATP-binding protein [Alphaproteobacteria bacterium]
MTMVAEVWQAANQAALVAALHPVYASLCRHAEKPEPADPATAAPALDPPAAIDVLSAMFALSPFERAVLLLCAGVELEGRFVEMCAAAQGDPRRGFATFGLALAALPDAHWSALSRDRPLRYWRLVEIAPGDTLTGAPLRIDERILHLLAGVQSNDERLDGVIAPMPEAVSVPAWIGDAAEAAARALGAPDGRVLLTGRSAADRALAAAEALRLAGLVPRLLRAADIPPTAPEREALARQWSREARLAHSGLCVRVADSAETRPLLALLARIDVPVLVEADEAALPDGLAAVRIAVPTPSAAERRQIWADSIGAPVAARMNGALDAVADQFSLDTPTIRAAGVALGLLDADGEALGRAAWRIGRAHARRSMEQLARHIEPMADWDSLVLPEA